jgi:ferric-dicitrate binding protein FerR (iron transport regulator)
MADTPFEILLDRYQSGEATASDVAALERLLRADPVLRRAFVERFLLEVYLHRTLSGMVANRPHAGRPLARLRRAGRWLAAAVLLAAIALTAYLWLHRAGAGPHEIVSGQVESAGTSVARIRDGSPFEVAGDRPAILRLADGSQLELEPASRAIIRGQTGGVRQVVELSQGGGQFQVAHGGGQFRVDTPVGKVTALGTRFSVRLKPPRRGTGVKPGSTGTPLMAVAVTEGRIEVETRARSDILSGGESRVFGNDGEQNNVDDGNQNNRDDH